MRSPHRRNGRWALAIGPQLCVAGSMNQYMHPLSIFQRRLPPVATVAARLSLLSLLVVMAAQFVGCNSIYADVVDGDGNVITQDRELTTEQAEAITAVMLTGSPDVTITLDGETAPSLSVTTDANLQEMIQIDIKDDTLEVNPQGSYSSTNGVKIAITLPRLSAATVSGSGSVSVSNVAGESFSANVTGSGDIDLAGSVNAATFGVSGSGDIRATDLDASTVTATVNGSGDIELTARNTANLTVNGSGDIVCYGNAEAKTSINGSGDINLQPAKPVKP